MRSNARAPIAVVVIQYVEDAAVLRNTRAVLASAPRVRLLQLGRLDERLVAHLDGIAVAGGFGNQLATAQLENPNTGSVFVCAVQAINEKDTEALDKLFALAEAMPETQPGLTSAFGWVSVQSLQGTGTALLNHPQPFRKRVAIAACAMHRVDPGAALDAAVVSPDAPLRAQALRCAGELGRRDLLPQCLSHIKDQDPACAFWAAWAAVLLGDRGAAVAVRQVALLPGPYRARALRLVLKVLPNADARALLTALSQNAMNQRALIRGTGFAGDVYYVPWLIRQMEELKTTRLAGEAFSMITGLDLAYLDLDQKPPENFETGPNDDPNDDNVAMDDDDGLPWPNVAKIQVWWSANAQRFTPGTCYFMGEPVSRAHCVRVLKEGFQRQRMAAAEYLCLFNPGTPLFNISAPAWRQKRLLDKME